MVRDCWIEWRDAGTWCAALVEFTAVGLLSLSVCASWLAWLVWCWWRLLSYWLNLFVCLGFGAAHLLWHCFWLAILRHRLPVLWLLPAAGSGNWSSSAQSTSACFYRYLPAFPIAGFPALDSSSVLSVFSGFPGSLSHLAHFSFVSGSAWRRLGWAGTYHKFFCSPSSVELASRSSFAARVWRTALSSQFFRSHRYLISS